MTQRATLSGRGFVLPLDRRPPALWRAIRNFLRPDLIHDDLWLLGHAMTATAVINSAAAADGFTYSARYLKSTSEGMSSAVFEVDVNPDARAIVSEWIGLPADRIWPPNQAFRAKLVVPRAPDVSAIRASAQAFRLAIDALPVGRDIRARLNGHIDAHIASIEAVGGRP